MSYSFENAGPLTLRASVAIAQYLRIHVDTNGQWAITGATAKASHVAATGVAAGAQLAGIPLIPGTVVPMIASEALTLGEKVYGAAAGKLDDVTTNCLEGTLLSAAAADGAVVPVLIMPVSAVSL